MYYLGLEIGGTKLQVALGDAQGHITALHRIAANPQAGAAGIRKQLLGATQALLTQSGVDQHSILGCGIGFGGPVDDNTQRTVTSHQVEGWDNYPLVDWVLEQLGLVAVLGNDADVAGLAEASIGAGRGCDPVFYMNVGSGIGGALILGGRIHRGTGLGAGEIGHLWVDYDLDHEPWQPRQAPAWSILEHRASGWAMQKAGGSADVPALLQAMEEGDEKARRAWLAARRRIALALTHVIALLCPRRIVLGGGVSLVPNDLFLRPLCEEIAAMVFQPFRGCYDIQVAALGEEVVLHGAMILARQRIEEAKAYSAMQATKEGAAHDRA